MEAMENKLVIKKKLQKSVFWEHRTAPGSSQAAVLNFTTRGQYWIALILHFIFFKQFPLPVSVFSIFIPFALDTGFYWGSLIGMHSNMQFLNT